MADGVVMGVFFILLLGAPLPMGANREWAWSPMILVIGAIAVLIALGLGARDGLAIVPREKLPLAALIICFTGLLGIGVAQMLPLASAPSAAFYAAAARVLGRAHAAVPTLAIDTSFQTWLKCLACGLLFVIARAACADAARARMLLYVLLASAVLVMIYALLELPVRSCFVGSYIKKQGEFGGTDTCTMSGTFVNSNSFGCFLGMAVAAAIGLLFGERKSQKSRRHVEEIEDENRFVAAITGDRLAIVALALFLTGGMLLSAARAAFVAFALSVLLFALVQMRGRWRSRRHIVITFVAGVVFAVLMVGLAGAAFLKKVGTFSQTGNYDRIYIWKTAVQAIEASPWWGWGLGSFADIYTVLQPVQIPMANDKAHSTPLETFVELGIPGGVLACLVVLIPWIVICRGALRQHRRRNLSAAALAASTVAIVHSFVDFSLQMPAIGFFVSALLGMGWAQVFASERMPSERRSFTVPQE